jgi:IS30 family transposase
MPRSYVHLSLEDRRKIARWHDAKMPVLEIAERLGRHRATIHRELKRNRFVDAELQYLSGYYALNAQSKTEARRAGLRKLIRHRDLRDVVVDRLKTGWTPQQIAGRLRLEGSVLQVSHETIYQFAYSKDGHAIDLWHHLPEHRRRRRGRGKRRSQAHKFADELSIRHRPEAVTARSEFGNWEGDLIQFRKEFGAVNVTSLVERVSRFTVLLKNADRKSKPVMEGIISGLSPSLSMRAGPSPSTAALSSPPGPTCRQVLASRSGSVTRRPPGRRGRMKTPTAARGDSCQETRIRRR